MDPELQPKEPELEFPTISRSMLELDPPLELTCALMEFALVMNFLALFGDGYL